MAITDKEQEPIQESNDEKSEVNNDEEGQSEKIPYPKSVFFILSNEFCERFNYYGMRTILIIYLTNILLYSEADAKIIYHAFTMLAYFFPVFGAILSDSYLGKFRTIFYVSMIYAVGSILLALTAAEPLHIPQKAFSIVGLLLIAVGTGGIKPCVAAFGGDQFVVPQQIKQLETFFSFYYFSINAGSLISSFLTPVLRNNVHCFDSDNCYPLAFAVPGILMVLSVVIFGLGKPLYKMKEPKGNIIVDVTKCISYAVGQKFKSKEKVDHFLDHSVEKFGQKLVNDVKLTLKVMVLYVPLPIFWALYDQQGSGWTFQAVRMNGDIGFYTILPDQMQVINPLLILAFIPIFTYWVYPLFAKCNLLKSSLQKMVCGGFLAAVAFAVSAVISIFLESTYPVEPSAGNIQLRFYNPSQFNYSISSDVPDLKIPTDLAAMSYVVEKDISFKGKKNVKFIFKSTSNNIYNEMVDVKEKTAYGLYISMNSSRSFVDDVSKSEDGYPRVRTLAYNLDAQITYKPVDGGDNFKVNPGNSSLLSAPAPGKYDVYIGDNKAENKTVEFKLGGTYTVIIGDTKDIAIYTITEPNSVHMLWLLPQYFIITAAEIMFSITGVEFSYSQAPVSMKSVLQACLLLTTAFGNLIIVLIESAKIFEKQSNDFFLYTGLMIVDMLIFTLMARRYKYVQPEETSSVADSDDLGETTKKISNGVDNPTFKSESAP